MLGRRRVWRSMNAMVVSCLVAGLLGGTLAATAMVGAGVAGADTSPAYTLTCLLPPSTSLVIPGTVTTGSLPNSVAAGGTLTLSNYGIKITLPSGGVFGAAAGFTVSGTYTTDLVATGATPASQLTTFDIPTQTFPNPIPSGGVPLSATATAGPLTAQNAAGTAAVTTSPTSTLVVNLTPPGATTVTPVTLDCTEPVVQISSTTVSAPRTAVTSVLPNAGPLAGGSSVTIDGTSLGGATAVNFGSAPGTITADSDGSLTAIAPPGPAGTVDVTVVTPIGTSAISPTDHFTYTDGPIVTGVSPSSGPPSGGTSVAIAGLQLTGATSVDFGATPAASFTVNSDSSITATSPVEGPGMVDVTVTGPRGVSVISTQDQFAYQSGYWEAASDGGIFAFGGAGFYGSMGGTTLNKPVVGVASTSDNKGYWEVASDGGIFAFGDAGFYGSMGGRALKTSIVAIAATSDSGGYWEVASDGGVFAFGDARFYGSKGAGALSSPIVAIVASPNDDGYWEVAADGAIFAFGNPGVYGSIGGHPLSAPIVGAAATSSYNGDWELASDGGIFAFGSAGFFGSMGGRQLNKPVVGIALAA